jgi:uncharacterized membrane protein YhaH (DUF805 family)
MFLCLWLALLLIVAYRAALALIGIMVFNSRANILEALILYSPLLYIPTLTIAAYRSRAGVYAGWASFTVNHTALCVLSWPHLAGLVVDLSVDWQLLLVSILLTALPYVRRNDGETRRNAEERNADRQM